MYDKLFIFFEAKFFFLNFLDSKHNSGKAKSVLFSTCKFSLSHQFA